MWYNIIVNKINYLRKEGIKNMTNEIKQQFWKMKKEADLCKDYNKVRKCEKIQELLENVELDPSDKYYSYYYGFQNGETIYNKFGRKLYFKLAKRGE